MDQGFRVCYVISMETLRWNSPDTAPKDGRRLLLAFKYDGLGFDSWDPVHVVAAIWGECPHYREGSAYPPKHGWLWMGQDSSEYDEQPDGWLPLPQPPT